MARQWSSCETRTGASTIDRTADLGIQMEMTELHIAYKMQTGNSKDIYLGGRFQSLETGQNC